MNSEKLLTAITGIDSKYIQEAQARLGYCTENKKRGGHKKLWRTLLIAAAISALFTAAAAAAGWFGLSGLKIGLTWRLNPIKMKKYRLNRHKNPKLY